MALVCAISNEVPDSPVISPVSGSVFEKRLIEKLLTENGNKDPVNGEILTIEMLIEIKTPPFVKAKPPSATSIPGILKSLQDEWDAVMLNCFAMRQQLNTARQELSHALYQHDAACRVIARLSKEVAAARDALATLKPQQANYISNAPMTATEASGGPSETLGISEEVKQKLQDTASLLTQERKKKGKIIPVGLAQPETIKEYHAARSHSGLHSAGVPGINCLDLQGNVIVTGGNDKCVTVFIKDLEQISTVLKGHSKKVVKVLAHPTPSLCLSGSIDATVRVWHVPTSQSIQIIRAHDQAITGLSLHPTGDYVLTSSMDHYWAFSDIRNGSILAKVIGDEEHPLCSAQFHPDGLIFATGTLNSNVKIWDLKEHTNVATFTGHDGPVTSIAFSENGYYLATSAEDASIKLWDLRKLKNFKTIQMEQGFTINDLTFDQSGSYLAFAGPVVKVYGCKTWNEIASYDEHTGPVTGIRFGPNCTYLASSSADRTLKIYEEP